MASGNSSSGERRPPLLRLHGSQLTAAAGRTVPPVTAFQLATAIAAFVAITLSILLNLRHLLAVFARGDCLITSSYYRPADLVGVPSKPHFVLQVENRGVISMDFRHFELLLPRLGNVFTPEGEFKAHTGAELFRDGQPMRSRLMARQEYRKIDFLTRVVRVEPRSSEVEFFELDAFLSNDKPPTGWAADVFEPVLQFRHAAGQEFHCDTQGVHDGPYRWPHEKELLTRRIATPAKTVTFRRSRFLRRWSVTQQDADIGQEST